MDKLTKEQMDEMMVHVEERQATKEAKAQEIIDAKEALRISIREEVKAERKTWKEEKGNFNIKTETELGESEAEQSRAFANYLKTGDDVVARKALSEGTGSAGGYLVPDDFYGNVVEKRDAASWVRKAGVQVVQTSRDKIDLPAEATSFTNFVRAAEAGSYDTNDPTFNQNQVTVEKYTKLFKVSEELVADDDANLESHLVNMIGRAYGQTEAYQAAVGTGSNEHEGIFTGGDTNALTFDTASNITPDEIWELFYTLGEGYRTDAFWLMNSQTWRYILSMRDTNNWAWSAADMAKVSPSPELIGRPVFLQDDIDTIATGVCTIMVGDPFYYALVERKGLEIKVLNELYAATGEIGYRCDFRQGGKVLVETAFVGGLQA